MNPPTMPRCLAMEVATTISAAKITTATAMIQLLTHERTVARNACRYSRSVTRSSSIIRDFSLTRPRDCQPRCFIERAAMRVSQCLGTQRLSAASPRHCQPVMTTDGPYSNADNEADTTSAGV